MSHSIIIHNTQREQGVAAQKVDSTVSVLSCLTGEVR